MPEDINESERAMASIAKARAERNKRTLKPAMQTSNAITAETLTPQPEFKITPPNPAIQTAALTGALESTTDQFSQELQDQKTEAQRAKDSSKYDFQRALANRTGIEGFTVQEEKNQDFQLRSDELTDINNQILQEQNALRRAKEAIQAKGGGLKSGAAAEINNLERSSLSKQADLSIIQLAKQGRYDSAKAMIDRKAKALFEEEENTIDALRVNYEDNKDLFDTAEQRVFESSLADRERKLTEEKEMRTAIDNFALDALQNGAPTSIVTAMQTSKTKEEALALGGNYIGLLDRQQKLASIRASNASADANEYELTQLKQAEQERKDALASNQLLPDQVKVVDEVDKEFRSEPIVKQYNEAVAKRFAVNNVIEGGVNGVQDLLLVYEFMKAIDPTSVVRETEFDMAAKTGNIFAGQYTKFNQGYFGEGGILPENVKASFLNSLNAAYSGKQQQYFNVRDQFGEKLERRGIAGGANYLTSYENGAPADTQDVENATVNQIVEVGGVRYRVLPDGNLMEI
jgi:hypothetical protein